MANAFSWAASSQAVCDDWRLQSRYGEVSRRRSQNLFQSCGLNNTSCSMLAHVQKQTSSEQCEWFCINDRTCTQLIRNFGWWHRVCVGHVVPYLTWALTATLLSFCIQNINKSQESKYLICEKMHVREETFSLIEKFRFQFD